MAKIELNTQPSGIEDLRRNAQKMGQPIYDEVPSGTINGSNDEFTLVSVPKHGTLRLWLNGLRLRPVNDFTVAGNTITLTTAPATGSELLADYHA